MRQTLCNRTKFHNCAAHFSTKYCVVLCQEFLLLRVVPNYGRKALFDHFCNALSILLSLSNCLSWSELCLDILSFAFSFELYFKAASLLLSCLRELLLYRHSYIFLICFESSQFNCYCLLIMINSRSSVVVFHFIRHQSFLGYWFISSRMLPFSCFLVGSVSNFCCFYGWWLVKYVMII